MFYINGYDNYLNYRVSHETSQLANGFECLLLHITFLKTFCSLFR